GVEDMNAFNARSTVGLKGDLLFRIYFQEGKAYFIKVGGSKQNQQMMAVQFGLLGGLIGYFMHKRQQRKTQEKLSAVAGLMPHQLLGTEKVNHVIDVS